MILAAIFIAVFKRKSDVIFIDQVSQCIPFFKFFDCLRSFLSRRARTKVLFYCHWPDQKLSKNPSNSKLKKLYRAPMDWFESYSIRYADKILVNSKFTQNVVSETFGLSRRRLEIAYPPVDLDKIKQNLNFTKKEKAELLEGIPDGSQLILSINRYEDKKNVALSIEALAKIGRNNRPYLIIAGGYDARKEEDKNNKERLENLVN